MATKKKTKALFPNKKHVACAACKTPVQIGAGFSFKRGGSWGTICASTACAELANIEMPDMRRRMLADGTVRTPREPQNLELLRSLPGARWNEPVEGAWNFSLDVEHRARVLEIADKLELDVEPSLRKFSLGRAVANRVAAARAGGAYPFQVEGVEYLASHKKCFLGDDMGTGKTIQALFSLPAAAKCRTIVVCPSNVKANWAKDEGPKWRPDLSFRMVSGKQKTTQAILPKQGEVVVLNFDILPADLKPTKDTGEKSRKGKAIMTADLSDAVNEKLSKVTLLVDEAHKVKNYKAAMSQKMEQLSRRCDRVIGMSGTPLTNKPTDLFGTLSSLDMVREVFGGFNTFKRLFRGEYEQVTRWQSVLVWPDYRNQPISDEAAERMRRIMLRRTKAEVLPELPAKTHKTMTVNGVGKAIDKAMDKLWAEYGSMIEGGELPPFEKFSELRAKLAGSRIKAAEELAASYEDAETPVLFFSAHRAPVEALGAREGWACILGGTTADARRDIVARFQAGELKGLALTIKAGCEGITLTRASNVVFVDKDWVPALNEQAEDRVCRIGQEATNIQITSMVSDHILDRHVNKLIEMKQAMFRQAMSGKAEVEVPEAPVEIKVESMDEMLARLEANDAAAAERLARLAEREREAEEAEWQSAVDRIHDRQVERAAVKGNGFVRERPITERLAKTLKAAFAFMMSVCDGAKEKDNMGFNKPDAVMARILMRHDLNDEKTQRALYAILSRYHRQLHECFPVLFVK
jgi:superfamily II DNA or RNA helicase